MDAESQLLAEKDAEIQRLKKEVRDLAAEQDSLNYEIIKKNKLIVELCDALEPLVFDYDPEGRIKTLLQRAREAATR